MYNIVSAKKEILIQTIMTHKSSNNEQQVAHVTT